MEERNEVLLTALFNSTGWIVACAQQDRQRQFELIYDTMTASTAIAIEVEREACAQIADHAALRMAEYTYGLIASESIAAAIRARITGA